MFVVRSVLVPQRRPIRRRLRLAAVAAAVGALVAMAAGCTNESSTAAAAMSQAPAGDAAPSAAAAAPSAGSGSAAASAGSAKSGNALPGISAGVEAADRAVIRTATLTLDVKARSQNKGRVADQQALQTAVDDAATRVRALATGAGYVSAADGEGTTQSITLRIPVGGYDGVMGALGRIATVTDRKESTEDVTSRMIDISSRLQTMTASVTRVRTLLSKADKIGDVIAIESELSAREADLESLQRQQAALAGQTSLSTITVVLHGSIVGVATATTAPAERSGFVGGLASGWDAVRKVGSAALTVVGTLIPFLPIVAVLVLVGVYWRRRVVRGTAPVLTGPAGANPGEPRPTE